MSARKIVFQFGSVRLVATPRNTPTAKAITAKLPLQASAQTWGEEVYFSVPVEADLETDARAIVKAGEIAFWVEGQCIAIGFGPTPISNGDEIRLAARTNIWADAVDDVRELTQVKAHDPISINWLE